MSGELSSILSGALVQEARLDVLANNAANIHTVGYKEDKVFRLPDTHGPVWEKPDGTLLDGMTLNTQIIVPVGSFVNLDAGRMIHTHNALDLAIDGKGFFTVQVGDKQLYTRKGDFTLDANRILVTQEGYPVMGRGGPITISGSDVEIAPDGTVIVDGEETDRIEVVAFPESTRMLKAGDCFFEPADPNVQPAAADEAIIMQGHLEGSNVDPIRVMTEMIDALRGYESYQKVMLSMNDTISKTVNDVGRIS
ncbi:MAG: flagellar basal-body rod protein FlgF [Thermodesulfobacteriota bacterium]